MRYPILLAALILAGCGDSGIGLESFLTIMPVDSTAARVEYSNYFTG